MKRIFAGLSMSVLLLTAGCSVPTPASPGKAVNRMTGCFTADVTMTTEESETKATLTRYGTDAWCVVFQEPATLSGVQLDFLDNEVKASYKGLEFSVPQTAQALKTELSDLMEVVDEMALSPELDGTASEDGILCEGELEVGSYSLTFTENGTPSAFSLPSYGLIVTFDTFTEMQPPVTEPETIPRATITDETEPPETSAEIS